MQFHLHLSSPTSTLPTLSLPTLTPTSLPPTPKSTTTAATPNTNILFTTTKNTICISTKRRVQILYQTVVKFTVESIECSRSERYVAVGGTKGELYIWEIISGRLLHAQQNAHYQQRITKIVWNDEETRIITGGGDAIIKIWDLQALIHTKTSAKPLAQIQHALGITGLICGAGPDTHARIVSCSSDQSCKIFNMKGEEVIADIKLPNHKPTCIFLSPLETLLYIGTAAGIIFEVALYPTVFGQKELKFEELKGHDDGVSSMSMSMDGSQLYSVSVDGSVRAWDCNTRQTISVYNSGKTGLNWCQVAMLPEVGLGKEGTTFSFVDVPMNGALHRDFSVEPEYVERNLCDGDDGDDERREYWRRMIEKSQKNSSSIISIEASQS